MKKPAKIIIISLLALVILGLILVPRLIITGKSETERQTQQQVQRISVDVYIVKAGTLEEEIKAVGTIRANEEAEIRSEVSRKVRGIYFKEGTFVGKGKTLFTLDADDLVAKLRKQEADEQLAIVQLERQKKLLERGLTSQEEYDIAQNTLDQIRADIAATRIEIARTSIHAPFSGIIGLRNVSKGSYVTPSVVLTSIQDISKIKVDFSIPEKYIYLFKKGQPMKFKVDGVEGEFEGEVYASEPKVEGETRSLVLRALCSNSQRKLLPGTFANVTFKLQEKPEAVMVPTESIVPKLKGQSVYVVKEGLAKLLDVELGKRTEQFVEITSGNINHGDSIVTTNILRLRPDAAVKIINVVN